MTNSEIIKYYENRIDDVEDESIKNELFQKLEALSDLLRDIDIEIDNAIEEQESDYLPYYESQILCNEFNQTERKC